MLSLPRTKDHKLTEQNEFITCTPLSIELCVFVIRSAAIRSAVPPEATEGISYGIPTFNYQGPLVWFAAFSNHCSLFPSAAVIEAFKDELKGFSTSKGTIHFPTDKPLPTALVKDLVKARIARNESKKRR